MIKRSLRVLLLACLAVSACQAADNPFAGDWKLNPAKSTLTDKMIVQNTGGNKYTFDFGGGPETIVVDGTDQPTPLFKNGTLAVAVEGNKWNVIRKMDGKTMISAHWSLSKDGSELMDHFTSSNPDGSPYELNYVYKRKAPGSGFAGTWVSSKLEAVNYIIRIQIKPFEDGGLSIVDADKQFTGNMNIPESAIRKLGENAIELMRKKGDAPLSGFLQLKLSADSKTLTMTPSVARDEPRVYVWDRQ